MIITNEQDFIEPPSEILEVVYPQFDELQGPNNYENGQQINERELIEMSRKQFLVKFHTNSIISAAISLIIVLLGFSDEILQSLVDFDIRYYQQYSYLEYKKIYNRQDITYEEYSDWNTQQQYNNTTIRLRWSLYLFFSLFIINQLVIVLNRSQQIIVIFYSIQKKYQKSLFYLNSALFGCSLLGIVAIYRYQYTDWIQIELFFIYYLSLLILNGIIAIYLTKKNQLKFQMRLQSIYFILCLFFNTYLSSYQTIGKLLLLYQMLTGYCFYYFQQLNHSLLIDPKELNNEINLIQQLRTFFAQTDQQRHFLESQAINLENDYIILSKKQILGIIGLIGFCFLNYILFTNLNDDYKISFSVTILIIIIMQFFDTQIASQTLDQFDDYLAASLILSDILSPFKNIYRSILNETK